MLWLIQDDGKTTARVYRIFLSGSRGILFIQGSVE